MKRHPKFNPGQRVMRTFVCYKIFTIDSIDEYRGRYVMDEEGKFGEKGVWGSIKYIDDYFIDADSPEGIWLRL